MNRKTGIWIDKREAYIIHLVNHKSEVVVLDSEIETYHVKGGSRSKTVYGPVITVKEKAYLEREKQQSKIFFDRILKELAHSGQIYIFGPADMKHNFKKHLDSLGKLHFKIISIETKDSMTKNQMIAEVKSVFAPIDH